jgi:hypothetical protein
MTRNARGNDVTNTKVSGNLINNYLSVESFNKALSRMITDFFFCILTTVAPATLPLQKSD